jgi:hypothetical protein
MINAAEEGANKGLNDANDGPKQLIHLSSDD